MVVDVTEVVDSEGSHQQIYFHQPMTSIQAGDTPQTYTVIQKHLDPSQHPSTTQAQTNNVRSVQNIAGFEVMYWDYIKIYYTTHNYTNDIHVSNNKCQVQGHSCSQMYYS